MVLGNGDSDRAVAVLISFVKILNGDLCSGLFYLDGLCQLSQKAKDVSYFALN